MFQQKLSLLGATRKAEAVADFVKTMFLKDLVQIKDTTKENLYDIEQEFPVTFSKRYCYNVFHGRVWGHDLVTAASGDMWNIGISIVKNNIVPVSSFLLKSSIQKNKCYSK